MEGAQEGRQGQEVGRRGGRARRSVASVWIYKEMRCWASKAGTSGCKVGRLSCMSVWHRLLISTELAAPSAATTSKINAPLLPFPARPLLSSAPVPHLHLLYGLHQLLLLRLRQVLHGREVGVHLACACSAAVATWLSITLPA